MRVGKKSRSVVMAFGRVMFIFNRVPLAPNIVISVVRVAGLTFLLCSGSVFRFFVLLFLF